MKGNVPTLEFSAPPDDPCVLDPMPCVLKYVAREKLEEEKAEQSELRQGDRETERSYFRPRKGKRRGLETGLDFPETVPRASFLSRDTTRSQRNNRVSSLLFCVSFHHYRVNLNPVNLSVTEKKYPMLLPGGRWSPKECRSRHRVTDEFTDNNVYFR